ncbi:zinc-ribbon domain-containing protein [Desulfovibrio inopinatus]
MCGAPLQKAKPRFCPQCGRETRPGAKFCGGCGFALQR